MVEAPSLSTWQTIAVFIVLLVLFLGREFVRGFGREAGKSTWRFFTGGGSDTPSEIDDVQIARAVIDEIRNEYPELLDESGPDKNTQSEANSAEDRNEIEPSRGPLIEAGLNIGQDSADPSHITEFLIDTGAERTVLSGATAVSMGLNPETDGREIVVGGTAGTTSAYEVDGPVQILLERKSPTGSEYDIEILDSVLVVPELTQNLLGRDILKRYEITIEGEDISLKQKQE